VLVITPHFCALFTTLCRIQGRRNTCSAWGIYVDTFVLCDHAATAVRSPPAESRANMSVKTACNSTHVRWQLGVVEKKIFIHERDVQEVNANISYLKSKCLEVGNSAAEKERVYVKKLETTHIAEERQLLRTKYLQVKTGTDKLNLKWATYYRQERDKVFPMSLELEALRQQQKTLRAQLVACVNTLRSTAKALDDIDCEKSKIAMDKWLAAEAHSVASLVPGLGRADHAAQLAHLRNGTLDKFHKEREVRLRVAQRKRMPTVPPYLPVHYGPSLAAAREINERHQESLLRETIIRQHEEREYQQRLRQEQLRSQRAHADMLLAHQAASPWPPLHPYPGIYGPHW